jgi:hypothetical protein
MKSEIVPGTLWRGREILNRWVVFFFNGAEEYANIYIYQDDEIEINVRRNGNNTQQLRLTTQADRMEFNEIWLAANMGYEYCKGLIKDE